MNRAQMRLEVRRALQGLNDDFWSDAELNDWLNEGVRVMCEGSHPLQGFYTFTTSLITGSTTEYKQEYPLPGDVDQVLRVTATNGGVVSDLKLADARRYQRGLIGAGIPLNFWTRDASNQAVSLTSSGLSSAAVNNEDEHASALMLGLYPRPASAMTISVWYFAQHFLMEKDTDACLIPSEFQRGPINYATALGKEKEGATAEADRAMAMFNAYKDRLKEHMISSGQLSEFPKVRITDDDPEFIGQMFLGWGSS